MTSPYECFVYLIIFDAMIMNVKFIITESYHLEYCNLMYNTFRKINVLLILEILFTELPIRILDFSHNSLRRLPEKLFHGLQDSLQELHLSGNLLGDGINPIYSSSEFHGLSNLRILDISDNQIRAIEEGLLKGCENLQVCYLQIVI